MSRLAIRADTQVQSVASPDGSRVVSGGRDGVVRVWDLATGAPVGEPLAGHDGAVLSVAVSPDGTRIVSGGADGSVWVWDLATGAPVGRPLTGHDGFVRSVAVSPDGSRVVSGGADGSVRVWDLATGARVGKPFFGHRGAVWSGSGPTEDLVGSVAPRHRQCALGHRHFDVRAGHRSARRVAGRFRATGGPPIAIDITATIEHPVNVGGQQPTGESAAIDPRHPC